MASAFAFVFRVEAEMNERVMALARFHHDVAAAASVAAGGPTARDELLPAKSHTTVATVAGLDPNDRLINKHAVYIDCTGQCADAPQLTEARSSDDVRLLLVI